MKGAIFYHSNSGNTRLVCQYLRRQLHTIPFELFDVAATTVPDPAGYDVVGFATWTYFLGLPPYFRQFLQSLQPQSNKPAFVVNTFGVMSGQALKWADKLLNAKGWLVMAGYSFHTPENYPPYILKGWQNSDAPTPKELAKFNSFVTQLDQQIQALRQGQPPHRAQIKIGFWNSLIRPATLQKARKELGHLQVDARLCDGCGLCQAACRYQAIDLTPTPRFKEEQCQACWACFNQCPRQAIFTAKIRGAGHYPEPDPAFVARLAD